VTYSALLSRSSNLMTTGIAAAYVGISNQMIRKLARDGDLTEVWLPGMANRRFLRSELDDLIQKLCSLPPSAVHEAELVNQRARAAHARAVLATMRAERRMGPQ